MGSFRRLGGGGGGREAVGANGEDAALPARGEMGEGGLRLSPDMHGHPNRVLSGLYWER